MLTTGKEQNYLVPILPETQCQMRYFVLLNTVFQILRIVGIKKCLLNEEDVQIRKCLINTNKMKRKKKAQRELGKQKQSIYIPEHFEERSSETINPF